MSSFANTPANHDPLLPPVAFVTPTPTAIDVHGTVLNANPGAGSFVDRRSPSPDAAAGERRQFGSSHCDLTPDAKELATAIDRYKIEHRRRYITCEEMLAVVKTLGYHRD